MGDKHGNTALHCASQGGHLDTVAFLISQGAHVNKVDEDEMTALHIASQEGHLDTVKYLISQGAGINMVNKSGKTPLHCASQDGQLDTVKYLFSRGADVNTVTKSGKTALHCALQEGHLDTVKYLFSQGADVNMVDESGKTALHCALQEGHLDTAKYLISHGADVNTVKKTNMIRRFTPATVKLNCSLSRPTIHDSPGQMSLKHSTGRQLSSPWSTLPAVFLNLFLICSMMFATSGFPLGTNVTIEFNHELKQEDSIYNYHCLVIDSKFPFFVDGRINPRGLKFDQVGRFDVFDLKNQTQLTVSVTIRDLHRTDSEVYIINIFERFDDLDAGSIYTYDIYIEVTYPPGRAECQFVTPHVPVEGWHAISCSASVGSDDSGHLVCQQSSKQLPYIQPVRHDGYTMTAVLWIDPASEIRCCSTNNAFTVDLDYCNDFVYEPSLENPDQGDTGTSTTTSATNATSSVEVPTSISGTGYKGQTTIIILSVLLTVVTITLLAAVSFILRHLTSRPRRRKKEDLPMNHQTDSSLLQEPNSLQTV